MYHFIFKKGGYGVGLKIGENKFGCLAVFFFFFRLGVGGGEGGLPYVRNYSSLVNNSVNHSCPFKSSRNKFAKALGHFSSLQWFHNALIDPLHNLSQR